MPTSGENVARRRHAIHTDENLREDIDYVVERRESVAGVSVADGFEGKLEVALRYVPDRFVLQTAGGLDDYLTELANETWRGDEILALAVLDDLNNELVPRWIGLRLEFSPRQIIYLEDRQPNWANSDLLSRLRPW